MRHNIGGCCDCGDEKLINMQGACNNHAGFNNIDEESELKKIPQNLRDKIAEFIQIIVQLYAEKIGYANLDYPLWVLVCQEYLKKLKITQPTFFSWIQQIIDASPPDTQKKIIDHEEGAYLYNMCFDFIAQLIEFNMPSIILVTQTLMKPVGQDTTITYLDLIVQNAVLIDNGHVDSRSIEEILYQLHANPIFKNQLQQTMLKNYSSLKLIRFEVRSKKLKQIILIDSEIHELPQEKRQTYFSSKQFKDQVLLLAGKYLKKVRDGSSKKSPIVVEYRSDLHKHHTQFIQYESQKEFFNSVYLSNYFNSYAQQYALITQYPLDDFGFIMNTGFWLQLRTEYKFFTQIFLETLNHQISPRVLDVLDNLDCLSERINADIYEGFKNLSFFGLYMNCLSLQTPANLNGETLFKTSEQAQLLTVNYLYIQQSNLGIWLSSFSRVLNSSNNQNFRKNLTLLYLIQCYGLILERNNQGTLEVASLNFDNSDPEDRQHFQRILILNATSIDRLFAILLVNFYFLMGLDGNEFLNLLSRHLEPHHPPDQTNTFLEILRPAVSRALSSYFMINSDSERQDVTQRLYNGQQNQQAVNLHSCDLSLMKMYLFLGDEKQILEFARLIEAQSYIDQEIVKHELICELLLGDLDLLNVSGMIFKQLPDDTKKFFAKYLRTLFLHKEKQSFSDLKAIFQTTGLLKYLHVQDYILDVCELDPVERELKLKENYHENPIYEPQIIIGASEVIEKSALYLQNNENVQINSFFGNGLENDFKFKTSHLSTMGPVRQKLWSEILKSDKIFEILFVGLNSKVKKITLRQTKILIRSVFYFMSANLRLNSLKPQKIKILKDLTDMIIQTQTENLNNFKQVELSEMKVILETISQIFALQKPDDPIEDLTSPDLKQRSISINSNNSLKNGQADLQTKNNCQACKLPLENSIISKPILIRWLQRGQENQVRIEQCPHVLHQGCFESCRMKEEGLIKFDYYCSTCGLGSNLQMDLILYLNDTEQAAIQVNQYRQRILTFIDQNSDQFTSQLDKYREYEGQKILEDILFIEFNLDILRSLFKSLIQQPLDCMVNNEIEIVSNVIRILKIFYSQNPEKYVNLFTDNQQNNEQTLIQGLKNVIRKYLFNELVEEQLHDNLAPYIVQEPNEVQEYFPALVNLLRILIFYPEQVRKLDSTNFKSLTMIQLRTRSLMHDKITQFSQKIGLNFYEFYMRYFPQGCSLCKFFPKSYSHKGTAEQYVCLICFDILCPQICEKPETNVQSQQNQTTQLGNLNHHALYNHNGQTVYLSLTTGYVTLALTPMLVQKYKNLFYDNMGQTVKILDPLQDWKLIKLDHREVSQIYRIIDNQSIPLLIFKMTNKVEQKRQKVDIKGLF